MKKFFTFLQPVVFICFSSLFLFSASSIQAQQVTNISDYVIFAGTSTALPAQTAPSSPGYAVQLGSSTNIQGGYIGSYKLIKTTGNSVLNTSLFSGGTVVLANSNSVTGKVTAANTTSASGTIFSAGSNATIGGNIDVKGNIVIGNNGTVSGKVTHPSGTTYSGPTPLANIIGTPALPVLPAFPALTNFPAFPQMPDINTTQTITPGLYDDIKLTGNKTLTFSGTGVYVFDLIDNSGTNNFIFDFKNDPFGTIKIYVHNYVELDKISVSAINGGSASKIFTEVHGTGNGTPKYAFDIACGSPSGAATRWLGTVWAPNAAINIGSGTGSSQITGALWSGTQVNIQNGVNIVYAPYSECTPPNANAGPDKALDFVHPTTLTGSSTTAGATFSWQASNGGVITSATNIATITVSAAGTYILTVTGPSGACTTKDTAIVTGKINNLIGSELLSINQNPGSNNQASPFFTIQNDSIYIDVIVKEGKYSQTLSLLTTPAYGLTKLLSNGASNFIITGLFPIAKLQLLNTLDSLIVYSRPYYAGVSNSGIVNSAGDTAMGTHLLRNGYGLKGEGIKVGVISDSYNTILSGTTNPTSNTAAQDVANGDLPGPGNPDGDILPVHVLKDYPFKRTDEGRAMLQIVHDVAPKAELYFRTGFISPGDFAAGIDELKQAGCNVIVDDITFITEPFLRDGVVSNAVNAAVAGGTTYFSSAGNFADKSYENTYNPVAAPAGLTGTAHNFGGGDIYQSVTFTPGDYTIVLQWEDDIYSLGQTATGGTKNDLDIYLTNNTNGTGLFGFNRNNTNGDPLEVLPFSVSTTTQSNILITNNTIGSNPSRFKYIIFRRGAGDVTFNEYATGTSTIIGQANAVGAITVGAARYDKVTPNYPGPLVQESFSSQGGTYVSNVQRNKPDIIAPDGVNTTVALGVTDYDHNSFINFFGTSAAAPHAAAVAALIMEGKKKFLNQAVVTPAEIKSLLQTTARDMNTPGFDFNTGFGFINPDSAMRTFAKPDPVITQLVVPQSVTPGQTPFTLTVQGQNLSSNTVIKFRGEVVPTVVSNTQQATAQIPAFIGNPSINAYTPPQTNGLLDGGSSDSLYFFNTIKKKIIVTADNKTKKYGQALPSFTATILVDSVPLQNTTLTLADIGMDSLVLSTSATASSNVGTYVITPSRNCNPANPVAVGLKELYTYTFNTGNISIQKLPLTVKAQDETITFGQKLPNTQFTYQFDGTNIPDSVALLNSIQSDHQSQIAKDLLGNDILGLVNGQAVTIVNGQAVPIVNGQAVTIVNGQAVTIVNGQAVPIVNGQAITIVNGQAVPIVNNLTAPQIEGLSFLTTQPSLQSSRTVYNKKLVNGVYIIDSTNVVDITQESVLDYNSNSAQTHMLNSITQASPKGLIDIESFTNGQAVTIVNGQAVTIVNGQAVTIVNGQSVTIVNGQAVTIVNGQAVPIVNNENKTAVILNQSEIGQGQSTLKSLNLATGLDAGDQFIIPGSLVDDNFAITHVAGKLTILPAPVVITPAANQTKVFGTADPVFTYSNNAGLIATDFTGAIGRVSGDNAGTYAYTLGNLSAGANYTLSLSNITPVTTFAITAKPVIITPTAGQTKVYGTADPVFTFSNDAGLATTDFTGALGRLSGNDVGSYSYTLGNLSAGTNYTLSLANIAPVATFAITAKPVTITPTAGQTKVYGNSDPVFTFSNDAGLTTADFTGALGRVSGSDVGNYSYTLGNLSAGSNYFLALSTTMPVATFSITAKGVLITPTAGQSKIYGNADPVFTFTNNGGLSNPNFTGSIGRVSGNNVGSYAYTLGNLSAGNNFVLTLNGSNTFAITKAPLQVKADDKVINKGDPLPTNTSVVTGLKYTDNPTVTYTYSPSCTGGAGIYAIIPSINNFANTANYTISYVNGTLYINPKGNGAKSVNAEIECVEEIPNPAPGQLKYIAHFEGENYNNTPVYVTIGTNNKLTSTGSYSGSGLPVLFMPGETYFNVPFDGTSLRWDIKSYEGSTLKTQSATASLSTVRCNTITLTKATIVNETPVISDTATKRSAVITAPVIITTDAKSVSVATTVTKSDLSITAVNAQPETGSVKIYPNPVLNKAIIYFGDDQLAKTEMVIQNTYGKTYVLRNLKQSGKNAVEIDLSGFSSGVYFIRVELKSGFKMFKIIKG
jgi:hypothetical protein